MGDIADAMLAGEICEGCQKPLHGTPPGHPRRCAYCRRDAPQDSPAPKANHPGRRERQRAKAAKGDPLPKWKLEAIDAHSLVTVRYHCTRCPRHFATDAAAFDHLRAVHGEQSS